MANRFESNGTGPEATVDGATREAPRQASRVLDVCLGVAGLLVAAPVAVAAAIAMRASGDFGPLLYRARRVGENGRDITVYKLRTMKVGAVGLPITSSGDDRITPVGRVLRRFKLDELPQFLNVVRADMSVVGPRPEDPRYVDWSDPLHRFVFSARPGITGPSQIAFRHEEHLLAIRIRRPTIGRCCCRRSWRLTPRISVVERSAPIWGWWRLRREPSLCAADVIQLRRCRPAPSSRGLDGYWPTGACAPRCRPTMVMRARPMPFAVSDGVRHQPPEGFVNVP